MSGPDKAGVDREPRFKLFRRTRGGVALTRAQVREIKDGRKKLRRDMRAAGIRSKYEFETTASSLGLYFDKRRGLLLWFFHGKGLWALLGAAALLIGALLLLSLTSQMRGYFTINMDRDLFREGFVLCETADFARPVTNLFCEPAVDVPCISITDLPADIDDHEGQHNGFGYFAYTYFVRNEGESTVNYRWDLAITGEGKNASSAAWILVFEDGEPLLCAEALSDGSAQTVPPLTDDTRGYPEIPVLSLAAQPQEYLQPIKTVGRITYHRVTPKPFVSETLVASGYQSAVDPMEVHKYTVVVWMEGDDPDCVDDLIGSHLGLTMHYALEE